MIINRTGSAPAECEQEQTLYKDKIAEILDGMDEKACCHIWLIVRYFVNMPEDRKRIIEVFARSLSEAPQAK